MGDVGRRSRKGETLRRPRVTLWLRSGREVTGFVLDLRHEGQTQTLLLHVPGFDRFPNWDVMHLPVALVDALVVHEVDKLSQPAADAPPAPSQLELKRRLAAASESLRKVLDVSVAFELMPATPEEHLQAIGELLPLVGEVLEKTATDEMGRQALLQKVKRVRLSAGADPGVTLGDGTLEVVTVVAPARRLTKLALARAVDAAL